MTSAPLDDQGPLPAHDLLATDSNGPDGEVPEDESWAGEFSEGEPPAAPTPTPARHRSNSRRAWWWVAAGVLVFLVVNMAVVAGVAGDWMLRSYEADRLITRIEASEKAMIAFQSNVQVAYATLGDPSTASEAQVAKAQDMLAAAVDSGLPAITAAGAALESLPIVPWHDSNAKARDAYVAHNHAWQDYLTRAQRDPAELDVNQPEVDSTFMAAEPLVRAAVSALGPIDPYDLAQRVDVIFAPPPQQEQAPSGDGGLVALGALSRR